jgi:Domain of unknown function DUF29
MPNNVMPAAADRQSLYERNYYTWALKQARALKEHRAEMLDWENLAEEVGDLARSETARTSNSVKGAACASAQMAIPTQAPEPELGSHDRGTTLRDTAASA